MSRELSKFGFFHFAVIPSRERSHIPPLEKENHRLKKSLGEGYVSSQEGSGKLPPPSSPTWRFMENAPIFARRTCSSFMGGCSIVMSLFGIVNNNDNNNIMFILGSRNKKKIYIYNRLKSVWDFWNSYIHIDVFFFRLADWFPNPMAQKHGPKPAAASEHRGTACYNSNSKPL